MVQFLDLLMRLAAASLEVLRASAGPGTALAVVGAVGAVGAIGLATLVVVACARYLVALAASLMVTAGLAHPTEPADRGELLSQSDPDADGHARPRAPTVTLQVA